MGEKYKHSYLKYKVSFLVLGKKSTCLPLLRGLCLKVTKGRSCLGNNTGLFGDGLKHDNLGLQCSKYVLSSEDCFITLSDKKMHEKRHRLPAENLQARQVRSHSPRPFNSFCLPQLSAHECNYLLLTCIAILTKQTTFLSLSRKEMCFLLELQNEQAYSVTYSPSGAHPF